MAWTSTLVERLRFHINDLDATAYVWTDEQLQKFLAISAGYVLIDLSGWSDAIDGPYTVDTSTPDISPDPTDSTSGFDALIVLKAGCVIAQGELKKIGSSGGWKIVDDRSTIDGTEAVKTAKDVAVSYCQIYKDMLASFKAGNTNIGEAILSPYSSSNARRGLFYKWDEHRGA